MKQFERALWMVALAAVLTAIGVAAQPLYTGGLAVPSGATIADVNPTSTAVPVVNPSDHTYHYQTYAQLGANIGPALPTPAATAFIGTSTDTSGTYTTPTNNGVAPAYLDVRVIGGGGGGGGGGTGGTTGGAGDNSTLGSSFLTANAGNGGGGAGNAGGAGGSASGGFLIIGGGSGFTGIDNSALSNTGGCGGSNPFGQGGCGTGVGQAGAIGGTCGGGGQGGGVNASATAGTNGGGGGSGGYVEGVVTAPAASYAYTAGKYGAASSAGTNGLAGGHGGPGCVVIVAHWQ